MTSQRPLPVLCLTVSVTALVVAALLGQGLPGDLQPVAKQFPAEPSGSPTRMMTTVTLYAARDNDPPGSREIAYPGLHDEAGGTGTYEDPISFAADPEMIPPGTRVYYPPLKRYFIMEDLCGACDDDWASGVRRIDLYAGNATQPEVIDCEQSLTRKDEVAVEVNPARGKPVTAGSVFNEDTGQCATEDQPATGGAPQTSAPPSSGSQASQQGQQGQPTTTTRTTTSVRPTPTARPNSSGVAADDGGGTGLGMR